MVGFILTSDELQNLFDILGLNENQSLVYLSLLSMGTMTVGQISQLTGLNYIQVRDAMEVLIGSEYVDWTPGIISRYFAREPFLKTFLLAYDPLTLISIRKTTKKRFDKIERDLEQRIQAKQRKISGEMLTDIQDILNLIKNGLDQHHSEMENEISALTFTIQGMKKRLKLLFQLSRKISASPSKDISSITSDLIFGETTFILLLKDLTSRAKASLTILMPHPEIQTLIATSKASLPVRTRTLIVGDFSKVPKSIINKVLSSNVRLKQALVDYWGCIRDNEEILIGPLPQTQEEELVGIVSTNPTMVRFFSQQIGSFTTKGHDLR